MLRTVLVLAAGLLLAALALPPLWFGLFPEPVPALPPAGRRVAVAGPTAVNLLERGAGPPVVLIHGHPGSAYDWSPLAEALAARGRRALAYDRVGYGRSDPRRDGAYTVAANASELLALLAAEELRDAILVGWSYGGGTAIVAARRDASRVAGLVLVGSVGPGVENRPAPPRLVLAFLRDFALPWVARVPPAGRRVRAALSAQAFAPEPVLPSYVPLLAANLARPDSFETFRSEGRDLGGAVDLDPAEIERPILVVHGAGDQLVPVAVGEELHRRAQQSELVVLPGAGHMIPLTRPTELADRIAAFTHRP